MVNSLGIIVVYHFLSLAALKTTKTRFGRLDILANNAGILDEYKPEDTLRINLVRQFYKMYTPSYRGDSFSGHRFYKYISVDRSKKVLGFCFLLIVKLILSAIILRTSNREANGL